MNRIFILLILCFYLNLICYSLDNKGQIHVKIIGFRNDKGIVQVSIFNKKDGFPSNYKKAYKIATNKITSKHSEVYFIDIPFGEYAISVLHDENENTKFETNLIGMPNEGVGSSNNVKNKFSSPSFYDSKFILNSEIKELNIEINYW